MSDSTTHSVLFPEIFAKPVVVKLDHEHSSSDGGALLLKAVDERLELSERLTACVDDPRQPGKVRHAMLDLLRQRIYAIACGYPDGNDAGRLSQDPIHKLLLERDPIAGERLASQPTLSRFENTPRRADLYRMTDALAEVVIAHHRQRLRGKVRRITVDMDPTDDPTHGQQELAFYNAHYGNWCYLPVVVKLSFGEEAEQYVVGVVLRPGNAPATAGAIPILWRLFAKLRTAFPKAKLRVRLDGGYAAPEIFDFLDLEGVEYLVAMAKNTRLSPRGRRLMARARRRAKRSGKTAHFYGETRYAARKWKRGPRRVIYKAEVVCLPGREPRDNLRFVVTNLSCSPRRVYALYRQRGDCENRIKELHDGLALDRTSCSRFGANQLRVLLTTAAYVLMQELRRHTHGTACAGAQVSTLRERLFKLGAWIEGSVRRVVVHLPQSFAYHACWLQVAARLGASTG